MTSHNHGNNDDGDDHKKKYFDKEGNTSTSTNLNERLSAVMKKATALLQECSGSRQKTTAVLERAREMAAKAGLSIDSYIVNPNHPANKEASALGGPEDYIVDVTEGVRANDATKSAKQPTRRAPSSIARQQQQQHLQHPQHQHHHHNSTIPPLMKVVDNVHQTGAYSNTDHYVQKTGDVRADRIAELKRHLLRRHRAMRPEDRGEERWDKPKLPGERRRRIVREKDLDIAPPDPPATGWIAFLSQMTLKIRHDRPKGQHDQAKSECCSPPECLRKAEHLRV